MFKEENLAAAQIAQIFGSHLLKVQESAVTDSGHKPAILNMDPRQFLVDSSPEVSALTKARERHITEQLQREAEAACPLPPEPNINNTPTKVKTSEVFVPGIGNNHASSLAENTNEKVFKSIERIANALEAIAAAVAKKPANKKPKKKIISK